MSNESLITRLQTIAPTLYSSACPYHNWDHAKEVAERYVRMASRLKRYGVSADLDVGLAASYLHDILWSVRPSHFLLEDGKTVRPALHKEEMHSHMARRVLTDLGAGASFIDRVCEAISATHPAGSLRSISSKLLRCADVWGMAFDSPIDYSKKWDLLHLEAETTSGLPIPKSAFAKASVNYQGLYTTKQIQLTPLYYSNTSDVYRSDWHVGASGNIIEKSRKIWPHLRVVAELGCGRTPYIASAPEPLADGQTIYIGIDHPSNLGRAVQFVDTHYRAIQTDGPMSLPIPHEVNGISLPDKSVDDLILPIRNLRHYQRQMSPAELARVLKVGGCLRLVESSFRRSSYSSFEGINVANLHEWLAPTDLRYEGEDIRQNGRELVFIN